MWSVTHGPVYLWRCTLAPDSQTLGVTDGDLPMTTLSIRLPISWVKKLRLVAASDRTDPSKLIRESIAMWADEKEINLYLL